MAGAIKGITIEFDGNTTKLSKALESVNKESKSLQSELRGINSLIKMDPSSTELLSQKQKVLAESISATKDKLETLKSVQAQVNEQFEKGDIGEKEYRDFQREIEATEQKLKSLTNEMKEFGSVSAQQIAAAGEKVKEVGGKIESAGKAMMPVTAALAGVGTAAVKVTADFDSAMSQVKALSGATGDDFDKLREKAQEMGAKTAFSATEAAEGLQYMALAGWDTSQMVGGIEGILNLAAAAQMDLGEASDIVTDALTAFGLSAEDSAHFADILAQTSSKANTDVIGLGEAFKYCAPLAGALGFTAEDTSLAIGLMANAGIKASQAGTSLRAIITRLVKPTKESGTAMDILGITITDSSGKVKSFSQIITELREKLSDLPETEKTAFAGMLAGQNAMSGLLAIVNASDSDVKKLTDSIQSCEGAAKKMADVQLDNLSGQMTLLKSALEGAMISIGDVITPTIRKIVEVIQSLMDKFNELPTSTKETIVAIGAIVAAIGPCLLIVGKLTKSVGSIMTMAPKIQGVFSALAGVIGGISGPTLAIVAAIGVLIAAFATLWKTNEEFRGKILSMWEEIKESFSGFTSRIVELFQNLGFNVSNITDVIKTIWNGFCNFLAPIFEYTFANLKTTMTAALDALSGILDIFIGIFTGDWSRAWEGVKTVFGSIWEYITGRFQNWYNLFNGIYGGVLDTIATVWSDAWNGICSFFSDIWNSIAETAQNAWNSIVSFFTAGIPNFFAKVKEWFEQLPYNIGYALGVAIGKVAQWVVDMVNKAHEMGSNFIAKVVEFFTQLPTKTAEFVTKTFENIKTWASNMTSKASEMAKTFLNNIVNTIKELPSKLQSFLNSALSNVAAWVSSMGPKGREAITSLINNAVSAAASIPSKMGEIGRNIVQGVWNGIVAAKNAFVNNVTNFFRGIVDGVKDALGIHSPSTVFANEIGYWIPPGIGKGVEKNADAAISPIKRIFDDLFSSDLTPVHEFTTNTAPVVISNDYSAILAMMSNIAGRLGNNKIYLDGKTLVGGVINYIDEELSRKSAQKARGM